MRGTCKESGRLHTSSVIVEQSKVIKKRLHEEENYLSLYARHFHIKGHILILSYMVVKDNEKADG